MALSRDARLLFIGIWNFADDEGRFKLSPLTLKAQIFPGDNGLTKSDMVLWLSEIVRCALVECYTNGRELFGEVTGWKKHQKIDRPQKAKHPSPLDKDSIRRTFAEYSAIVRGEVSTDRIGEERRGVEGSADPTRAHGAESRVPEQTEPTGPQLASQPDAPSRPNQLDAVLSDLARDPTERERALQAAETLVRVEFARRFEAAEGSLWTRSGDPAVATLAQWACSVHGGPEAAVKRLLDSFFADDWCRSQHFDVRHLARHPQRYFEPRKAPAQEAAVDRDAELAKLRARRDELHGLLVNARVDGKPEREAKIQVELDKITAKIRALKGGE